MTFRQFLALELAVFLPANPSAARPPVLGVVVEANRVHVNTGEVSAGATVYDGDHFTTDAGGMLVLRGEGITLELVEESALAVRSRTDGELGAEAEFTKGTLIFSAERAAALEINVLGARVNPIADTRTIGQVTIVEPKELRIYAKRGSLQFSYRGETETIAEGAAFRVILDPPDDQPEKQEATKTGRKRKAFLLIAIAAGAAGGSVFAYERDHHHRKPVESPDRP